MTNRAKLLVTVLLILATGERAVSSGAALSAARDTGNSSREPVAGTGLVIPRRVVFRDVPGRGLLVRTWVNSAGPFNFAIDTGAGATLLSQRVANEAQVKIKSGRAISIAGLSGAQVSARPAALQSLAIGDRANYLPARGDVIVTGGLPPDLDGILDPVDAFAPLGFEIDLPRLELSGFDPRTTPLRSNEQPAEGTVVHWLRESHGRRPFVLLDNGDRALLDTGSSLGLAIRDRDGPLNRAANQRVGGYGVRDLGGGRVSARRVSPVTVSIGSLMLRRVPTDVISGAAANAPVLLGLGALRPFRLRFDPVNRLIEIAPN